MHCTAINQCAFIYTAAHCTAVHCTVLQYTAFFTTVHSVLFCCILHCTAVHSTVLRLYTVLHCIAVHCTAVQWCTVYIAQHCTVPYITLPLDSRVAWWWLALRGTRGSPTPTCSSSLAGNIRGHSSCRYCSKECFGCNSKFVILW